jgi:hypothetical protein
MSTNGNVLNVPGYKPWLDHPRSWAYRLFDFLSDEELSEFTNTPIATGAATVENEANGVLAFNNNGTDDNSGAEIQLDADPFLVASGRLMTYMARFKVSDADQCDVRLGFAVPDATWIAGVSDCVQLKVDDGDGILDLQVIKASGTPVNVNGLYTLADDIWYVVKMDVECVTADVANIRVWTATRDADAVLRWYYLGENRFTAMPAVAMSAGYGWISGAATDMSSRLDSVEFAQTKEF